MADLDATSDCVTPRDTAVSGSDVTASWNGFRLDRTSGRVLTPVGFSCSDRLNQTFGGFEHDDAFLLVSLDVTYVIVHPHV